jgi:hypothetical protein
MRAAYPKYGEATLPWIASMPSESLLKMLEQELEEGEAPVRTLCPLPIHACPSCCYRVQGQTVHPPIFGASDTNLGRADTFHSLDKSSYNREDSDDPALVHSIRGSVKQNADTVHPLYKLSL